MAANRFPTGVLSDKSILRAFPETRPLPWTLNDRLDRLEADPKRKRRLAPHPPINDLSLTAHLSLVALPELVRSFRARVAEAREPAVRDPPPPPITGGVREREAMRERYYYPEQGEHQDRRQRTTDQTVRQQFNAEWMARSAVQYPQAADATARPTHGSVRGDTGVYYTAPAAAAA